MEHRYLECDCDLAEHTLRFVVDSQDYPHMRVEAQLSHYMKWYERLWLAVKYVFGYQCKTGHWAETMLTGPEVEKLRDMCDEHLKAWEKYNDQGRSDS